MLQRILQAWRQFHLPTLHRHLLVSGRGCSETWKCLLPLRLVCHQYHHPVLHRRGLLMSQFEEIKKQYAGYILLFQVGDFYELYSDDASDVASKTSLRLTKKNNVFMAGFPVRALDEWQRTLVEAGFQLAICNQIRRNCKDGERVRLMGREVVKLVTPGTLLEPLDQRANYLLCIATGPGRTLGLAWVDVSTAEFQLTSSEGEDIDEDLERICPSEVLLSENIVAAVKDSTGARIHPQPVLEDLMKSSLLKECHLTGIPQSWFFDGQVEGGQEGGKEGGQEGGKEGGQEEHSSAKQLELQESLKTKDYSALELSAAFGLLHFVMHTQRSVVPYLTTPSHYSHKHHMAIDANTRRALELVSPLHSNPRKATLLGCIDRTVTAAGARLLRARLASPLTDVEAITRRLAVVELFSTQMFHCETIANHLRSCADLERVRQKVATGSATTVDLVAIRNTLYTAGEILDYIRTNVATSEALAEEIEGLYNFPSLTDELQRAIGGVKYGDYILSGYSAEVDALRESMRSNERRVNELAISLRNDYKVARLTVAPHRSYIRVFEVTRGQAALAESCPELIKVDQTQGKTRFSHFELQRLNAEMQALEATYARTQDQLFQQLCDEVMSEAERITETARALARLDVSTSLALLAADRGYTRPDVVGGTVFDVRRGAHPVVASLRQGSFVGNDCNMGNHKLWIVTGPNMGGKSTFLRQNALIAILAQMGSFVPAEKARLGVVDRLFARVGASDNVARHMSTFHMEMSETANILTNATSNSFVILDEIGRGTSTTEGLSIAQAVMEHLHDNIGCRTLLATHFHQLAVLGHQFPNTGCYCLMAEKDNGGLVFTYQIKPGHSDCSFGIEVAQLAGIPRTVIRRAQELLLSMQPGDHHLVMESSVSSVEEQHVLTAAGQLSVTEEECLRRLAGVSVEQLTPLEALNLLNQLKYLLASETQH